VSTRLKLDLLDSCGGTKLNTIRVAVYNFLQASTAYCLFVFLTLVIALTLPLHHSSRPCPGVDGQKVAIAAIAFLFFIFTCGLFLAHTRLILLNITTIEELGLKRQLARERAALMSVTKWWDTQ
jgi:palmitoyltransferase